jgi:hypothetical protein
MTDFTKNAIIEIAANRDLALMKKALNFVPAVDRSAEAWNKGRANFQKQFPASSIYALDASGFIVEWLRG